MSPILELPLSMRLVVSSVVELSKINVDTFAYISETKPSKFAIDYTTLGFVVHLENFKIVISNG